MEDKKLVPQTVYLPVNINERLPKKDMGYFTYHEDYFIGEKIDQSLGALMFENGIFEIEDKYHAQPSHWLEKKQNQVVISIDEFKEQLKSAYNAGRTSEYENKFGYDAYVRSTPTTKPDLDTYIDNLLCKKNNSK